MFPADSGSRLMPRKMAGSAMMTTDPSSDAMKMAAVVLARAIQAYASGFGGFGRPAVASVVVLRAHQSFSASRSSSTAAALSWPSSSSLNPFRSAAAICSVRAPRLSCTMRRPASVIDSTIRLPSSGSRLRSIRPALKQRRDGHAHRLRADPVKPGQVARRGRAAALKARQRRGLGEGQLARERRLPQLAHDKPHGDAQRPRDLTDIAQPVHLSP